MMAYPIVTILVSSNICYIISYPTIAVAWWYIPCYFLIMKTSTAIYLSFKVKCEWGCSNKKLTHTHTRACTHTHTHTAHTHTYTHTQTQTHTTHTHIHTYAHTQHTHIHTHTHTPTHNTLTHTNTHNTHINTAKVRIRGM